MRCHHLHYPPVILIALHNFWHIIWIHWTTILDTSLQNWCNLYSKIDYNFSHNTKTSCNLSSYYEKILQFQCTTAKHTAKQYCSSPWATVGRGQLEEEVRDGRNRSLLLLLCDGSLEEEVGDGGSSRMMLLLRGAGSRRTGQRLPVAGAAARRGRSQRVTVAQRARRRCRSAGRDWIWRATWTWGGGGGSGSRWTRCGAAVSYQRELGFFLPCVGMGTARDSSHP
jgi:hypothetical protein